MRYRELLVKLSRLGGEGFGFSSILVSLKVGCSVVGASKSLSRLHGMGFLVRQRLKRTCISKHGKLCSKGYRYEYSLSGQGWSYLRWMNEQEPIQTAIAGRMFDEVSGQLSDKVRKSVMALLVNDKASKYKGSNLALRTLGLISPIIILELNRKLVEVSKENQVLIYNQLLNQQRLQKLTKNYDMILNALTEFAHYRNGIMKRRDEEMLEIQKILIPRIIDEGILLSAALTIIDAYRSIDKSLESALILTNPKAGSKLVQLYRDRQKQKIFTAEAQLKSYPRPP